MPHTEETKRKISEARRGKKMTDEQRKRVSEAHKGLKYGPRTEEQKKHNSEKMRGRKLGPQSEETKKKLSEALRGRIFSQETRAKISKALTGVKHTEARKRQNSECHKGLKQSEETRRKRSNANSGPNSKSWKGGTTTAAKKRVKTFDWKLIRAKILKRDNFICQICDCGGKRLNVHHKLPVRLGGTDDESNLITLCVHHHIRYEQLFMKYIEPMLLGGK